MHRNTAVLSLAPLHPVEALLQGSIATPRCLLAMSRSPSLMHSSLISIALRPTIRCAFAIFGILACSVLAVACAEKRSIDESAAPFELPEGYGVSGSLTRAFCLETLRVGDTVSALLSPSRFSGPTPFPQHFRVLLRSDAPTRGAFNSVSADADGYHIDGSIGFFMVDVESGRTPVDRPHDDCYGSGSRVEGHLSRALRIPRIK